MADTAEDDGLLLDSDHPWPGLAPFTEGSRTFFHGRDAEAAELARCIRRGTLTILFGRSGLGKTSLLRAGLPVELGETYLPVYLRLDLQNPDQRPVDQIKAAIVAGMKLHGIEGPLPQRSETLWAYFHNKGVEFWTKRNRPATIVLILDQFEEVFTLGKGRTSTQTLLTELMDLAENRPPLEIQAELDASTDSPVRFNFSREPCKIVLSLREDFLADLEQVRRHMPSIMGSRVRLTQMDRSQALDAVLLSAEHLISPIVAEEVISFVSGAGLEDDQVPFEIEPALLSVVCRELNEKRIRVGSDRITSDLLDGARTEIISDFYTSSLEGLGVETKRFIEEELLTASGFRDSRPRDDVVTIPGITEQIIDQLVERRVLRVEERNRTSWVELTHDLLTGVIRQQRDARRVEERNNQALRESEEQALAARTRAENAERQTARARKATLWIGLSSFVVVILIGTMTYLVDRSRKQAQEETSRATAAIRIAIQGAQNNVDLVSTYHMSGGVSATASLRLLDVSQTTFSQLPRLESESLDRQKLDLFLALSISYSRIGNLNKAREAAQTALNLANQLMKSNPSDSVVLQKLWISYDRMGDILFSQHDNLGADSNFRLGLETVERMQPNGISSSASPQSSEHTLTEADGDEATTLRRLGSVRRASGQLEEALKLFQTAIDILKGPFAADASPDVESRRELALDYSLAGEVHSALGNFTKAQEELKTALEIAQRLDQTSADGKDELATIHESLGDLLLQQSNASGLNGSALIELGKSLDLYERLAAGDADNLMWQQKIGLLNTRIGVVLQGACELPNAKARFESSLKLRKQLAADDSTNSGWQRNLWAGHNFLGTVLQEMGDLEGAEAEFRAGFDSRSQQVVSGQRDDLLQRDLASSQAKIGMLLKLRADQLWAVHSTAQARETYNNALTTFASAIDTLAPLVGKPDPNPIWKKESDDAKSNFLAIRTTLLSMGDKIESPPWDDEFEHSPSSHSPPPPPLKCKVR